MIALYVIFFTATESPDLYGTNMAKSEQQTLLQKKITSLAMIPVDLNGR